MSEWHFTPVLLLACMLLWAKFLAQGQMGGPVSQPAVSSVGGCVGTIATEQTWVSPYWGYNTPKIVFDGSAYYTVGMRGPSPDEAEGIVYKYVDGTWIETARLPGIYQPPTLLLDSQRRLIVLFTRNLKPVAIWRAKHPGDTGDFDVLPPPGDMPNAYYIGVAIDGAAIHLAYVRAYLDVPRGGQDYSMLYTRLDLDTLTWTPSHLVQAGQATTKPKTAWTYPVLVPGADGLHMIASNSPDGGEGNTYNRVEYLFYPRGSTQPSVREVVAEGTIGHATYGYAMTVGADGTVHVLHLWNQAGYGPALPAGSASPGVYHSWRPPGQVAWQHQPINWVNPRFYNDGRDVFAVGMKDKALQIRQWLPRTASWSAAEVLCTAESVPAGPAFMDVLRASSGSVMTDGLALVADGRVQADASGKQPNLSWAILPPPPPQVQEQP
jgi:hypothetical protein